MGIRDIEITNLEGRRFTKRGERQTSSRIDTNSSVTQIVVRSPKEADIDFRFTVNYGAGGSIKIEGRLIYEGDAKTLAAEWEDKHNMPNPIANEIHNAVVQICILESVMLAKDLQLPPPIPIPRVQFEEKDKKKGKVETGIEVA